MSRYAKRERKEPEQEHRESHGTRLLRECAEANEEAAEDGLPHVGDQQIAEGRRIVRELGTAIPGGMASAGQDGELVLQFRRSGAEPGAGTLAVFLEPDGGAVCYDTREGPEVRRSYESSGVLPDEYVRTTLKTL